LAAWVTPELWRQVSRSWVQLVKRNTLPQPSYLFWACIQENTTSHLGIYSLLEVNISCWVFIVGNVTFLGLYAAVWELRECHCNLKEATT